jgi:hypothetical protein
MHCTTKSILLTTIAPKHFIITCVNTAAHGMGACERASSNTGNTSAGNRVGIVGHKTRAALLLTRKRLPSASTRYGPEAAMAAYRNSVVCKGQHTHNQTSAVW